MKISKTYKGGIELERSIFQVKSIDIKHLEQLIGQEYHGLYWLMDDVFGGEKFKKDAKWPVGLGHTDRLIEEPAQVIEAFYKKDAISEDLIIEFFACIGIEIQKEIDPIVLEKVLEKDEKNRMYREYVEGKSDILPDGMTKEQGETERKIANLFMRMGNNRNIGNKEKNSSK